MDNLVKDLKRKIAQLEQKNKKIAQKLQSKRSSLRYYQARCRQLLKSRDNWKSKAQVRLNPSKPSFRISQETFGGPIPARHQYSAALIFFCIQLRVKAGCSYRSIVLILQILMEQASSQQRLPCVNTLKNWVEKLGLFLLSRRPSWSGQAVLIVDELIGRAQERLLMCLLVCRSPSAGQALDTSCVQVVHLEARPQWRGQDIAQVIGGIEQKLGQPISYLLSDGDHKLTKAARELGRAHQWDISHFLARALRKTFEDSPEYKAFIQSLGAWRAHSVCSSLSLLAPPKQRAKARFMNQGSLVAWYKELGQLWEGLSPKAQKFFEKYPKHQAICQALGQHLQLVAQLKKLIQVQGSQGRSRKKARKILRKWARLPSKYAREFVRWAMPLFQEPTQGPKKRPFACSDIIESLFGTYKSLAPSHPMAYIGPICLQLPIHTLEGGQIKQEVTGALEEVFCSQLLQWKQKNLPENQITKKNKRLKSVLKKSELCTA